MKKEILEIVLLITFTISWIGLLILSATNK